MEAAHELNVLGLGQMVSVFRELPTINDVETECGKLEKIQDDLEKVIFNWRSKQAEKHSRNIELQQQVAVAERKLVSVKMEGSNNQEVEHVKEQLAQAQSRERQMQADINLEDCLEAIEEQMESIKLQKETLEKPDADEAFLKNELSLFLNVSSILPDLGDPKFSGTYVDKQKGVKTFKFSAADMSPFETCKAAWDMMK